jgi:membrane-bound serine protease (ClpP class)
LVLFLTNFWVRGVLIAIFLVSLFVEMTHPGAMLPGIIAAAALVGIIAPPLLIGMASWWEVGAILLGIALIALEIFIFPGFGIPGIIGLIALFGGLVATFIPGGQGLFPDTARGQADLLWGAVTLILSVTSAAVVLWLFFRNIKSIPAFNRLILKNPGEDDVEVSTLVDLEAEEAPTAAGEVGVSITPLRPAGRVQIGDRVIDAVSEFGLIPAGVKVRVSSVSPFRITVERVESAPGSSASPTDPATHG